MLQVFLRGWLVVARKIGYLQSRILLTLVYFFVIAPFALAVRLFSDPLRLRGAPSWCSIPRGDKSTPSLDSVRQQS